MKKQAGFTLIELIIVIIVLGILAAFAIPRYMNFAKEGRIATVKGMRGSLLAAAEMVHGMAQAQQINCSTAGATVTIDTGQTVTLTTDCYPTADSTGIVEALSDTSGFVISHASGVSTFNKEGAKTPAACTVSYTQVGHVVSDITDTGC